MFIDDVSLVVKAGNGGNGMSSFRREKYVSNGGPSGGNGGRGGDIIFIGDEGLTTLLDLRYQKKIRAEAGENGKSKNMFGKDAKDVYIRVPVGSIIYDADEKTVLADITKNKQEAIIAKGGRGGRGNASFATPKITAPEYAENGFPGETRSIRIELKILADVGLVGFPSVGKSTLISVISKAKPKIADYPFTTLVPNLGVVEVKDGRSFVMADLPGLIEGASSGSGLGFEFLKHIERTRVIVHVVDVSNNEGRKPYDDYLKINHELITYNPKLMMRPQIIVANKMDLDDSRENFDEFKNKIKEKDEEIQVIPISAYTKSNLDELLYKIADTLELVSLEDFEDIIVDEVVEYTYIKKEAPFTIVKGDDHVYVVSGPVVERYFNQTNFDNDQSVQIFSRKLRLLGVDDELRKLGVKNGDSVRVLKYEFEFFD